MKTLIVLDPTDLASPARILAKLAIKGGPGSGNFGHAGRPGEVGGSAPQGASTQTATEGKKPGQSLYERHGALSDVTDRYEATVESLKDDFNSRRIVFAGGEEVYINRGTSYTPRNLAPLDRIMKSLDGKVVVGPADWLDKDAADIPELVAEVDRQLAELTEGVGGDFAKATPTEGRGAIAHLLHGYKSPLTFEANQERLNVMAQAYFDKTSVRFTPDLSRVQRVENDIASRQKMMEQYPDLASILSDYNPGKDLLQAKLLTIEVGTLDRALVSQGSVNQFAAEVERTQKDLAGRYGDTLTLYRGVAGDYAKALKKAVGKGEVDIEMHPLASWTSDLRVAKEFAKGRGGVVIKQEIPRGDILFSHHTSPYIRLDDWPFGGKDEAEFVVGHRTGRLRVKKGDLL